MIADYIWFAGDQEPLTNGKWPVASHEILQMNSGWMSDSFDALSIAADAVDTIDTAFEAAAIRMMPFPSAFFRSGREMREKVSIRCGFQLLISAGPMVAPEPDVREAGKVAFTCRWQPCCRVWNMTSQTYLVPRHNAHLAALLKVKGLLLRTW
ncbi:hypothetical protein NKH58_29675 [Mesorhizobium australicum]|uniref:hypothetical protein n=1 Tax=Mesorhizobium australicum TaxID=536018 RepID=UPI00333D8EFC